MTETLPFPLGTFLDDTDSAGNYVRNQWQGRVFSLPSDTVPVAGASASRRSGMNWTVMCVRNVSTIALVPSRVAKLKATTDGISTLHEVSGYANVIATPNVGIVDEFLPAAGVPNKALFWLFIGGPVYVRTPPLQADFNSSIAIDGPLVSAASGTSLTDTDGGRIANPGTPGSATAAMQFADAIFARAMEAKVDTAVNTLVLVNLLPKIAA